MKKPSFQFVLSQTKSKALAKRLRVGEVMYARVLKKLDNEMYLIVLRGEELIAHYSGEIPPGCVLRTMVEAKQPALRLKLMGELAGDGAWASGQVHDELVWKADRPILIRPYLKQIAGRVRTLMLEGVSLSGHKQQGLDASLKELLARIIHSPTSDGVMASLNRYTDRSFLKQLEGLSARILDFGESVRTQGGRLNDQELSLSEQLLNESRFLFTFLSLERLIFKKYLQRSGSFTISTLIGVGNELKEMTLILSRENNRLYVERDEPSGGREALLFDFGGSELQWMDSWPKQRSELTELLATCVAARDAQKNCMNGTDALRFQKECLEVRVTQVRELNLVV